MDSNDRAAARMVQSIKTMVQGMSRYVANESKIIVIGEDFMTPLLTEEQVAHQSRKNESRIEPPEDLPPDVRKMVEQIEEKTGCVVLLAPLEEASALRREAKKRGLDPVAIFYRILSGLQVAIEAGAPAIMIALPSIYLNQEEPANGKADNRNFH